MQETIIICLPFAVFPNEVHLLWKDIRLRKKNFVQETRISDRYCFLIWLLIRIKYRYCLTELCGFLNITFDLYSLTNNFALVVVLFVFIRFVLVRYHIFFYLDRCNGSLFKLLSSFKMEKKFTIFVLRLISYVTADFALCPTVCTFYIFWVFVNKKYIFKMSWA